MSARASVINAVLAAAAGRTVGEPSSMAVSTNRVPSGIPKPPFGNPMLTPALLKQPIVVPPPPSLSPAGSSKPSAKASVQVYSVRVPQFVKKKYNIMRFNGAHKIDFSKWKNIKMQREDNSKHFAPINFGKDEMPKFGAGSEFGRDKREAARRRKYGMYRKKYKPQDQPWILKLGDQKPMKRYKGMNEGGVNDNASYFIFKQTHGHFDVYPIKQWINFTPIQTYKSLSAEEAEEEFGRRNKIMNLFTVMVRKRMKVDDVDDEEQKTGGKAKKKDPKAFKMSEMDDWDDDDEDDDDGSDDNESTNKKPKKKDKKKPEKKKKKDSDDEPVEDSDDGDEEGLELDYISDSSEPSEDEDSPDKKSQLAGVDEQKGGLLDSETSEEESQEKKKDDPEQVAADTDKKKKPKKKKEIKEVVKEDSDSSDHDMPDLKPEERKEEFTRSLMEVSEPIGTEKLGDKESLKRKATFDIDFTNTSKKSKLEVSPALLQLATSEGITEEAVRKYLLRKPMTVAELLQKFKPKKTKIPNEDMVPIIAHILKKINPAKRTQNFKLYFFLKS